MGGGPDPHSLRQHLGEVGRPFESDFRLFVPNGTSGTIAVPVTGDAQSRSTEEWSQPHRLPCWTRRPRAAMASAIVISTASLPARTKWRSEADGRGGFVHRTPDEDFRMTAVEQIADVGKSRRDDSFGSRQAPVADITGCTHEPQALAAGLIAGFSTAG